MNHSPDAPPEGIKALLAKIGLSGEYVLVPLKGGRNNRAFKLECGGHAFFLKEYFYSSSDPRDRLHHEFSFTCFAWSNGIHTVPEPLVRSLDSRLGIYEFICGQVANYRSTTADDISQATDFVLSINRHRAGGAADQLPSASEACFSISDHAANTAMRVKRLSLIEVTDDEDETAQKRIAERLRPLWQEVVAHIDRERGKERRLDQPLTASQRWLSPSDFGFHNAIEESNGRLRFIDFEYAGWDDPAKLLCDFANQPDRILEESLVVPFIQAIIDADVDPHFLQHRYALLEPLYQIKWACIILNEFMPTGRERRKFTRSADVREKKRSQLEKLDVMLDRVSKSLTLNR